MIRDGEWAFVDVYNRGFDRLRVGGSTEAASAAIAERRSGIWLDKKRLAEYTGYSVSWIEKMIREGAPVERKGRSGVPAKIDSAQFINFIVLRERKNIKKKYEVIYGKEGEGASEEESKRRFAAAKAAIIEIDLDEKRGKFVDVEIVCEMLDKHIAACRARLLSLPKKTAPFVIAAGNANKASGIIESAIREALNELSRLDPADFIGKGVHKPVEAAAKADA